MGPVGPIPRPGHIIPDRGFGLGPLRSQRSLSYLSSLEDHHAWDHREEGVGQHDRDPFPQVWLESHHESDAGHGNRQVVGRVCRGDDGGNDLAAVVQKEPRLETRLTRAAPIPHGTCEP